MHYINLCLARTQKSLKAKKNTLTWLRWPHNFNKCPPDFSACLITAKALPKCSSEAVCGMFKVVKWLAIYLIFFKEKLQFGMKRAEKTDWRKMLGYSDGKKESFILKLQVLKLTVNRNFKFLNF